MIIFLMKYLNIAKVPYYAKLFNYLCLVVAYKAGMAEQEK